MTDYRWYNNNNLINVTLLSQISDSGFYNAYLPIGYLYNIGYYLLLLLTNHNISSYTLSNDFYQFYNYDFYAYKLQTS